MRTRTRTAILLVAATAAAIGTVASMTHPCDAAVRAAERGKYLVTSMGCSDCHTPWTMGPNGPAPDESRSLSGHPADLTVPPPPELNAPWILAGLATNTAWAGPWGISFTANLTPDPETGTGKWTAQDFVDTIRSGRHLGRGRPLLPPMPAQAFANLTDEDLRAIFAYLQTLPPIQNRVPEPIAPR